LNGTNSKKEGEKIREIIQAIPWSGGPCIFLCLKLENGQLIGEWTNEELNNC